MLDRIAVLIDGFNFYHAIEAHIKSKNLSSSLKWLNYRFVIENIILKNQKYDDLKINFYTAVNTFKRDNSGAAHKSTLNHHIYVKALKTQNISVIEGKFKLREEKLNSYFECHNCKNEQFVHKINISFPHKVICSNCHKELSACNYNSIKKPEEKKTDVKIAIDLINIARDGNYNKIYLFSTDSDFIPPVEYIKQNCPNVEIIIVAPADKETNKNSKKSFYRYATKEFEKLGVFVYRLRLQKLVACLFDDEITDSDGKILKNPWIRA